MKNCVEAEDTARGVEGRRDSVQVLRLRTLGQQSEDDLDLLLEILRPPHEVICVPGKENAGQIHPRVKEERQRQALAPQRSVPEPGADEKEARQEQQGAGVDEVNERKYGSRDENGCVALEVAT